VVVVVVVVDLEGMTEEEMEMEEEEMGVEMEAAGVEMEEEVVEEVVARNDGVWCVELTVARVAL